KFARAPRVKGKSKRSRRKVVKSDAKPRPAAAAQQMPTGSHQSDGQAKSNPSYQSAAIASSATAKPGIAITKNNLTSPDDYEDEEEEDDSYGNPNVSKSERRRLKKLARREQQRRAD